MDYQDLRPVTAVTSLNRNLADRYRSRRGFVHTMMHRFLYHLGCYRSLGRVDWAEVNRLVFVCHGNICRSPFAEAVAKKIGLDAVSCGIHTRDGLAADRLAIAAASRKGVDLQGHRTSTLGSFAHRDGDLFVAVEPGQAAMLAGELGGDARIALLGLWYSPRYPHIPDPYQGSAVYFDRCFDLIEHAVTEMAGEFQEARQTG